MPNILAFRADDYLSFVKLLAFEADLFALAVLVCAESGWHHRHATAWAWADYFLAFLACRFSFSVF